MYIHTHTIIIIILIMIIIIPAAGCGVSRRPSGRSSLLFVLLFVFANVRGICIC